MNLKTINQLCNMLTIPTFLLVGSACSSQSHSKYGMDSKQNPLQETPGKAEQETAICTICFEPLKEKGITKLHCSTILHPFHTLCIRQWVEENRNAQCPLCKGDISNKSLAKKKGNGVKLLEAAEIGDLATLQSLVVQVINRNIKDEMGWTALHFAANNLSYYMVRLLIVSGFDIHVKNNKLFTPLHCAVARKKNINKQSEVIQLLLSKKADVNAKNDWEWTPLHFAVQNNSRSIAKLLLKHGADINQGAYIECPFQGKNTPLHIAIYNKHVAMVEFLIKKGANINAQNSNGLTPLDLAILKRFKQEELTSLFVQNGGKKNIENSYNDTLLHFMVKKYALDIVQPFLKRTIKDDELNAQNDLGQTPLHIAVEMEKGDIVVALVNLGANTIIKDKNGKTPLDLAKAGSDIHQFLSSKAINLSV